MRVWALDLDDLIEIAKDELTRTLTDEECDSTCTWTTARLSEGNLEGPGQRSDQGLRAYPPWDSNPEPAD